MSTVGDVGLQSCWHSAAVHNAGTELTDWEQVHTCCYLCSSITQHTMRSAGQMYPCSQAFYTSLLVHCSMQKTEGEGLGNLVTWSAARPSSVQVIKSWRCGNEGRTGLAVYSTWTAEDSIWNFKSAWWHHRYCGNNNDVIITAAITMTSSLLLQYWWCHHALLATCMDRLCMDSWTHDYNTEAVSQAHWTSTPCTQ